MPNVMEFIKSVVEEKGLKRFALVIPSQVQPIFVGSYAELMNVDLNIAPYKRDIFVHSI